MRGALGYPTSSQGILWRFLLVLGWPLAIPKHVSWSQLSPFCGTITDFREIAAGGAISLRVKRSTVDKVHALVCEARQQDRLTPAEASSLRGKLLWVWLYAKVGRARIGVLAERQRAKGAADEAWAPSSPLPEHGCRAS